MSRKLKRALEIATIIFLLMLFIALIVVIIMGVNLIFRYGRTGISVNRRVEKTTQPVEKLFAELIREYMSLTLQSFPLNRERRVRKAIKRESSKKERRDI